MRTLFMTGTINPPSNARTLKHTDVAARIGNYRESLRFYFGLLARGKFDHLVFVENSGYGMARFNEMVAESGMSDRVELLSFDGNSGADRYERLYLEALLMQHAFDVSALLNEDPEAMLWKVTGRYVVGNIAAIADRVPGDADLVLHCKDYPLPHVDFAVIGMRARIAQEFLRIVAEDERTKLGGERAVRDILSDGGFGDLRIVRRMPRIPDYHGIRGSDGMSYEGPRYRAKHMIRVTANAVLPRLWI